MKTKGLDGKRVVAFENRRATEIAEMIRRHGGEAVIAPAMRERAVDDAREAIDFIRALEIGEIDVVIAMTGVGVNILIKQVESEMSSSTLALHLGKTTLVARGPKPVAALKSLGLQPQLIAPSPNTWRELLQTLDAKRALVRKRIAILEYGEANATLCQELRDRGASVRSVVLYRWALPEDLGPLREAIDDIRKGRADIALFTSATQVKHLFEVAGEGREQVQKSLRKMLVGSIGPICSERLLEYGIRPQIEAEPPKMGYLLRQVAACLAETK